MTRIFYIIFFSIFISACSNVPYRIHTASDLEAEGLIGVWLINHDAKQPDYSLIEYQRNGDKCELAFSLSSDAVMTVDLYWNSWRLESNTIATVVQASTTDKLFKGLEINDEIQELSNTSLIVTMTKPVGFAQKKEIHIKNPHAAEGQICDVVRNHFTQASPQPSKPKPQSFTF